MLPGTLFWWGSWPLCRCVAFPQAWWAWSLHQEWTGHGQIPEKINTGTKVFLITFEWHPCQLRETGMALSRAGPLLGREFQRAVTRSWLCCKACREILSSKSDFLITTLSRFSTAVTSAQEVIHDRQALTDVTKKSLAGKFLTQRRILGAALG